MDNNQEKPIKFTQFKLLDESDENQKKIKEVLLQLFTDKQRENLTNSTIEDFLRVLDINISKNDIFSINKCEVRYDDKKYSYIIIHCKNGEHIFFRKIANENNNCFSRMNWRDRVLSKGPLTLSLFHNDYIFSTDNSYKKRLLSYINGDIVDCIVNGNLYEGEFKDTKCHGKGKYTFASGDVYEGEFKDRKFHGTGKLTFASGNVYEGEFKNDEFNGTGKLTFASGDAYKGEFKTDHLDLPMNSKKVQNTNTVMFFKENEIEDHKEHNRIYRNHLNINSIVDNGDNQEIALQKLIDEIKNDKNGSRFIADAHGKDGINPFNHDIKNIMKALLENTTPRQSVVFTSCENSNRVLTLTAIKKAEEYAKQNSGVTKTIKLHFSDIDKSVSCGPQRYFMFNKSGSVWKLNSLQIDIKDGQIAVLLNSKKMSDARVKKIVDPEISLDDIKNNLDALSEYYKPLKLYENGSLTKEASKRYYKTENEEFSDIDPIEFDEGNVDVNMNNCYKKSYTAFLRNAINEKESNNKEQSIESSFVSDVLSGNSPRKKSNEINIV